MSSIPKAMKFLQVHYETLTELYQTLVGATEKVFFNNNCNYMIDLTLI